MFALLEIGMLLHLDSFVLEMLEILTLIVLVPLSFWLEVVGIRRGECCVVCMLALRCIVVRR